MKDIHITYKKINKKAKDIEKSSGDLGFDLSVVGDDTFYTYNYQGKPDVKKYELKPNERKLFHTGLKFSMTPGYGFIIKDRSGMAAKYGIHVLAGVVDSSYTGEVLICLLNTSDVTYCINEGDRIAQGVIIPEYRVLFEEGELEQTERGERGFGSSGK